MMFLVITARILKVRRHKNVISVFRNLQRLMKNIAKITNRPFDMFETHESNLHNSALILIDCITNIISYMVHMLYSHIILILKIWCFLISIKFFKMKLFGSSLLLGLGQAQWEPNYAAGHSGMVHLFEVGLF